MDNKEVEQRLKTPSVPCAPPFTPEPFKPLPDWRTATCGTCGWSYTNLDYAREQSDDVRDWPVNQCINGAVKISKIHHLMAACPAYVPREEP